MNFHCRIVRSLKRFLVVTICVCFLPLVVVNSGVAHGQSAPDRAPNNLDLCKNHEEVDLLIVTDQSQSMGKDSERGEDQNPLPETGFFSVKQALKSIKAQLGAAKNVHVGLIGFADWSGKGSGKRDFFSNESLSDQEIYDATHQNPGNGVATNYTSAFSKAAELFEDAKEENAERCRALLFFTDGLIENSRGIKNAPEFASDSRSEICARGGEADVLNNLDVTSIAVVLDPRRSERDKKLGIPPSMGSLLALTGDIGSPLFQKWYNEWEEQELLENFNIENCDRPTRKGVIIGVDELDRLPSVLLRAVVSTTTRPWEDCNNLNPPGDQLPDGAFIESIMLFAEDGVINGAKALNTSPKKPELNLVTEKYQFQITQNTLKYFQAGWKLVSITTPGDASLNCRVQPVSFQNLPATAKYNEAVIRPGSTISVSTELPNIRCESVESITITNTNGSEIQGNCGDDGKTWEFNEYKVPDTTSREIRSVGVIEARVKPKYENNLFGSQGYCGAVEATSTNCMSLFVNDNVVPIGDALGTCDETEDLLGDTKIILTDSGPQVTIDCTLAADESDQTDFEISWIGEGGNWSTGSGSGGGSDGSGGGSDGSGGGSDGSGGGSDGSGGGSDDSLCTNRNGDPTNLLERTLPPKEVESIKITTEFCEDLVGELCITPVGAPESRSCTQIELIIDEELRKIASTIVECSSNLLSINGNGGELPKEPLNGDAGCEMRENPYGKVFLTVETDDPVNSLEWGLKPKGDSCEVDDSDPFRISLNSGSQACQFLFQTTEPIDNGNYERSGANHKLILSVQIPTISKKSIKCELEDSQEWNCDLIANMDFKKRSNPLSWLFALLISLTMALLMYGIWYSIMRRYTRFRKGTYSWTKLQLLDIERIDNSSKFRSETLQNWDRLNHDAGDWNNLVIKDKQYELKFDQMKLTSHLPPIWQPHKVLSGGWAQVERKGWAYVGWKKGPKPGSMKYDFSKATIVGVRTDSNTHRTEGVAYFIQPISQPIDSGGDSEKLKEEAIKLLDDSGHYLDDQAISGAKNGSTVSLLVSKLKDLLPKRKTNSKIKEIKKNKADQSKGRDRDKHYKERNTKPKRNSDRTGSEHDPSVRDKPKGGGRYDDI